MQSKKIIAGTMAVLLAFGSVYGSFGAVANTGIVASAETAATTDDTIVADPADGKDVQAKFEKAVAVAGYQALKLKDSQQFSDGTDITSDDTDALNAVIADIINRVNNIKVVNAKGDFVDKDGNETTKGNAASGVQFWYSPVDGNEVIGVKPSSDPEKRQVILASANSGNGSVSGVLEFNYDGNKQTISFNVAKKVAKADANGILTAITNANGGIEGEKLLTATASTTAADVATAAQKIATGLNSGATVEVTHFDNTAWSTTYKLTATIQVKTSDTDVKSQEFTIVATKDTKWNDVVANAEAAVKKIEFKAGDVSTEAGKDAITVAKEKVITALADVTGLDKNKTTVKGINNYTAPDLGKTGHISVTYFINGSGELADKNAEKTVEFDIPAITKTADEELGAIREDIKKAVEDYRYFTSDKTTAEEIQKVASDVAKAKGATLTPEAKFDKTTTSLTIYYKLSYPGAEKIGKDGPKASDTVLSDTVTIMTVNQKAAEAKSEIVKVLGKFAATNDTTADDVLKAANDEAAKKGVSVKWDVKDPFVKLNATELKSGDIFGTLNIEGATGANSTIVIGKHLDNTQVDVKDVRIEIKRSTFDAYELVKKNLKDLFNNPVSAQEVVAHVYTDSFDDVTCDSADLSQFINKITFAAEVWSDKKVTTKVTAISVVDSTASTEGTLSGNVLVTAADGKSENIPFSIKLPKLVSLAERVDLAKTEAEDILNSYPIPYNYNIYTGTYKDVYYVDPTATDAEITKEILNKLNARLGKNNTTKDSYLFSKADVVYKYGNEPQYLHNDKDAQTVTGTIVISSKDGNTTHTANVNVNLSYAKSDKYFDQAVTVAQSAINTFVPNNTTGYSSIKEAIMYAFKQAKLNDDSNTRYYVEETNNKLVTVAATDTTDGSVKGDIYVVNRDTGAKRVVNINLVIPKLASSTEILNGAKKAIDEKLKSLEVSNDTKADEIITAANAAIEEYRKENPSFNAIKIEWNKDNGFKVTPAEEGKAGAITGTFDLTYNDGTTYKDVTDTYAVNLEIPALPAEVTVDKVVASSKFTQTKSAVRINWTPVEGAVGYRVYKYDPATKKFKNIKTIVDGSANNYRVTGLKSGTTYKFKVRAYTKDADNKTVWGEASNTITTATNPAAPTITKNTTAKTAVRIYFTKPTGATGFIVYKYDTKTKTWKSIKTLSASATNYRVEGLKSKTSYKFKVKAIKKVGSKTLTSAASATYTAKTK